MCDVKIRNYAVLERAHRHNRARRSADNILRGLTHAANRIVFNINRNNRRLTDDDAFALHVYQCIGSTEIDTNIFRKKHNTLQNNVVFAAS